MSAAATVREGGLEMEEAMSAAAAAVGEGGLELEEAVSAAATVPVKALSTN